MPSAFFLFLYRLHLMCQVKKKSFATITPYRLAQCNNDKFFFVIIERFWLLA